VSYQQKKKKMKVRMCECFEDQKTVDDYFPQQVGHGVNVFSGVPRQRGYGLGSILSRGLSLATPLLTKQLAKREGKHLGNTLINAGLGMAADVLAGKSLKSSAASRLKSTGKSLLSDTVTYLAPKPSKKSRKRKAPSSSVKKGKRARTQKDIFG